MTTNVRKYKRVCPWCEEQFKAARPSARFCSGACRSRWHEEEDRADCPECGKPMRAGSAYPAHSPQMCQVCERAQRRQALLDKGAEIERWWQEGATVVEIGKRLGWSPTSSASVLLYRLRELGLDLPYRNRGNTTTSYGTKFPHLRKAA